MYTRFGSEELKVKDNLLDKIVAEKLISEYVSLKQGEQDSNGSRSGPMEDFSSTKGGHFLTICGTIDILRKKVYSRLRLKRTAL
jgi:hypothetical protein